MIQTCLGKTKYCSKLSETFKEDIGDAVGTVERIATNQSTI